MEPVLISPSVICYKPFPTFYPLFTSPCNISKVHFRYNCMTVHFYTIPSCICIHGTYWRMYILQLSMLMCPEPRVVYSGPRSWSHVMHRSEDESFAIPPMLGLNVPGGHCSQTEPFPWRPSSHTIGINELKNKSMIFSLNREFSGDLQENMHLSITVLTCRRWLV